MTITVTILTILLFAAIGVIIRLYRKNERLWCDIQQTERLWLNAVKETDLLERDIKILTWENPIQAKKTWEKWHSEFAKRQQAPILKQINDGAVFY